MSPTTKILTADHSNSHFPKLTSSSSKMKKVTKTKSSQLQFFVRMMWKCDTIVIRASREDTVKSLLQQILSKTKIPIEYQRLIYKGKQLQKNQSLGECGIENDANLQLVAYLQSIACHKVWKDTQNIVSLILRLCKGELGIDGSKIIHDHFAKYMIDSEYFSVFMFMKIPLLLVALYMSPASNNSGIADLCVKSFMEICLEMQCKTLQGVYLEAILEFCELLRGVGCKCDDPLYVFCRNGFASLLVLVGGVSFKNPKRNVLLQGIFAFVHELADGLLRYLDSSKNCATSEGVSCSQVVRDFLKFSKPLRIGISDESVKCGICYYEDPLIVKLVDQLHIVFLKLLSKMFECLQVMEDCLVNKKYGEGDGAVIHNGWSHYLIILEELCHISKLYSNAKEMFWEVLLHQKNMLSHLIVRYSEKTDDHRWVLENRSVTNFESRRHLALMLFPDLNQESLGYEMLIDRSQILAESLEYISQAKPKSLEDGLFMEFKNEEGTGPGVIREWLVLVCQEIFNPERALFVACPNDRRRFFPNAASKVNPLHLKYFSFSGRMIALALKNKVHVGIVFDRVFFKQLAGNYTITLEDIRDADPIMHRSCKQILEMDADYIDSDALGLTFSIEVEELGHRKVIELFPGGESLVVDSKNRKNYVDLLIHNRFVTSISEQVLHFAKGFADIISGSRLEFFQILDLEDLDRMLHGSENAISVEDWKAHTKYQGYKKNDRQISWFWKIVGKMSAEQRKVLLFFWTSVKHLPVEGFHGLNSRLFICKSHEPQSHLPSSHTCFYELCFPPYSSMAIMQDRLGIITQEHIGCSFGTP